MAQQMKRIKLQSVVDIDKAEERIKVKPHIQEYKKQPNQNQKQHEQQTHSLQYQYHPPSTTTTQQRQLLPTTTHQYHPPPITTQKQQILSSSNPNPPPENIKLDSNEKKLKLKLQQEKMIEIAQSSRDLPSKRKAKNKQSKRAEALKKITKEDTEVQVETTPKNLQRKNLLWKMETSKNGPLKILYDCVTHGLKAKVWIRRYKGLRGVITGYIVAFDVHMNLAMIDVEEVYTIESWMVGEPLTKQEKQKKKQQTEKRLLKHFAVCEAKTIKKMEAPAAETKKEATKESTTDFLKRLTQNLQKNTGVGKGKLEQFSSETASSSVLPIQIQLQNNPVKSIEPLPGIIREQPHIECQVSKQQPTHKILPQQHQHKQEPRQQFSLQQSMGKSVNIQQGHPEKENNDSLWSILQNIDFSALSDNERDDDCTSSQSHKSEIESKKRAGEKIGSSVINAEYEKLKTTSNPTSNNVDGKKDKTNYHIQKIFDPSNPLENMDLPPTQLPLPPEPSTPQKQQLPQPLEPLSSEQPEQRPQPQSQAPPPPKEDIPLVPPKEQQPQEQPSPAFPTDVRCNERFKKDKRSANLRISENSRTKSSGKSKKVSGKKRKKKKRLLTLKAIDSILEAIHNNEENPIDNAPSTSVVVNETKCQTYSEPTVIHKEGNSSKITSGHIGSAATAANSSNHSEITDERVICKKAVNFNETTISSSCTEDVAANKEIDINTTGAEHYGDNTLKRNHPSKGEKIMDSDRYEYNMVFECESSREKGSWSDEKLNVYNDEDDIYGDIDIIKLNLEEKSPEIPETQSCVDSEMASNENKDSPVPHQLDVKKSAETPYCCDEYMAPGLPQNVGISETNMPVQTIEFKDTPSQETHERKGGSLLSCELSKSGLMYSDETIKLPTLEHEKSTELESKRTLPVNSVALETNKTLLKSAIPIEVSNIDTGKRRSKDKAMACSEKEQVNSSSTTVTLCVGDEKADVDVEFRGTNKLEIAKQPLNLESKFSAKTNNLSGSIQQHTLETSLHKDDTLIVTKNQQINTTNNSQQKGIENSNKCCEFRLHSVARRIEEVKQVRTLPRIEGKNLKSTVKNVTPLFESPGVKGDLSTSTDDENIMADIQKFRKKTRKHSESTMASIVEECGMMSNLTGDETTRHDATSQESLRVMSDKSKANNKPKQTDFQVPATSTSGISQEITSTFSKIYPSAESIKPSTFVPDNNNKTGINPQVVCKDTLYPKRSLSASTVPQKTSLIVAVKQEEESCPVVPCGGSKPEKDLSFPIVKQQTCDEVYYGQQSTKTQQKPSKPSEERGTRHNGERLSVKSEPCDDVLSPFMMYERNEVTLGKGSFRFIIKKEELSESEYHPIDCSEGSTNQPKKTEANEKEREEGKLTDDENEAITMKSEQERYSEKWNDSTSQSRGDKNISNSQNEERPDKKANRGEGIVRKKNKHRLEKNERKTQQHDISQHSERSEDKLSRLYEGDKSEDSNNKKEDLYRSEDNFHDISHHRGSKKEVHQSNKDYYPSNKEDHHSNESDHHTSQKEQCSGKRDRNSDDSVKKKDGLHEERKDNRNIGDLRERLLKMKRARSFQRHGLGDVDSNIVDTKSSKDGRREEKRSRDDNRTSSLKEISRETKHERKTPVRGRRDCKKKSRERSSSRPRERNKSPEARHRRSSGHKQRDCPNKSPERQANRKLREHSRTHDRGSMERTFGKRSTSSATILLDRTDQKDLTNRRKDRTSSKDCKTSKHMTEQNKPVEGNISRRSRDFDSTEKTTQIKDTTKTKIPKDFFQNNTIVNEKSNTNVSKAPTSMQTPTSPETMGKISRFQMKMGQLTKRITTDLNEKHLHDQNVACKTTQTLLLPADTRSEDFTDGVGIVSDLPKERANDSDDDDYVDVKPPNMTLPQMNIFQRRKQLSNDTYNKTYVKRTYGWLTKENNETPLEEAREKQPSQNISKNTNDHKLRPSNPDENSNKLGRTICQPQDEEKALKEPVLSEQEKENDERSAWKLEAKKRRQRNIDEEIIEKLSGKTFQPKTPIKGLIFKKRNLNQLFIRGDNIVMVAYDIPEDSEKVRAEHKERQRKEEEKEKLNIERRKQFIQKQKQRNWQQQQQHRQGQQKHQQ